MAGSVASGSGIVPMAPMLLKLSISQRTLQSSITVSPIVVSTKPFEVTCADEKSVTSIEIFHPALATATLKY
jgi:hypothetical protein